MRNSDLRYMHHGYKAGNILAFYDAMQYCQEFRLRWPRWVQDAAAEFVALPGLERTKTTPKKKGRNANPVQENKCWEIHRRRHAVVEMCMVHGYAWTEVAEYTQDYIKVEGLTFAEASAAAEKRVVRNHSLEHALESTCKVLEGDPCAGGRSAISASYQKVKKLPKENNSAIYYRSRYYSAGFLLPTSARLSFDHRAAMTNLLKRIRPEKTVVAGARLLVNGFCALLQTAISASMVEGTSLAKLAPLIELYIDLKGASECFVRAIAYHKNGQPKHGKRSQYLNPSLSQKWQ